MECAVFSTRGAIYYHKRFTGVSCKVGSIHVLSSQEQDPMNAGNGAIFYTPHSEISRRRLIIFFTHSIHVRYASR